MNEEVKSVARSSAGLKLGADLFPTGRIVVDKKGFLIGPQLDKRAVNNHNKPRAHSKEAVHSESRVLTRPMANFREVGLDVESWYFSTYSPTLSPWPHSNPVSLGTVPVDMPML